jgi:hypothetical protein
MSGLDRPVHRSGAPFRARHDVEGRRVFRIQSTRRDFEGSNFRLQVPAKVARLIGPDAEFTFELTEEGILFRKVGGPTRVTADLPEWLR